MKNTLNNYNHYLKYDIKKKPIASNLCLNFQFQNSIKVILTKLVLSFILKISF